MSPNEQEPFASWLLRYMTDEHLTPAHIAVMLHVTPKTVYEWLRGRGPHHAAAIQNFLESRRYAAQQVKKLFEF